MSALSMSESYNRDWLELQYGQWSLDPQSVEPTLAAFFQGVEFAGRGLAPSQAASNVEDLRRQIAAVRLITAYRDLGHLLAYIDPLASGPPTGIPWALELERFTLTEADLKESVDARTFIGMGERVKVGDVLQALRETYCRTIGVEFMHIQPYEQRRWLVDQMEPSRNRPGLPLKQKIRILMSLQWAELFEQFLHRKYAGQKRFSLEGGETLLSIMDTLVELAPSRGVKELVIGMAHRGRLSVLANILQKPFEEIFNEFEDVYLPESSMDGDGDVKYHMGFSADVTTSDGSNLHLSLAANPSHLEAINPVVEGRVRAKQQKHGDLGRSMGVPVLIHGDAALAGQGMVMETINLANLEGYRTGGTVHIVVNNQIGFTTRPSDSRSTKYCTDIAKIIQAPIFHVNAEDPEACAWVAQLALDYRQQYKADVVIDMVCFRKYGHNEGDEPSFTQPLEYQIIAKKPGVASVYRQQLVERGDISTAESQAIEASFKDRLEHALTGIKALVKEGNVPKKGMTGFSAAWSTATREYTHTPVNTGVSIEVLDRIGKGLTNLPEGFTPHPKLMGRDPKTNAPTGIINDRTKAVLSRSPIDWGTAESLAYGSLVLEGHPVRLSGQDVRRGTFSHRHACLFDYKTGAMFCPVANLDPKQAFFKVYDSSLSEAGVLGFEYGYSLEDPNVLVIWEAQFGDFSNGAQVIIDQFIAAGESKWNRASGLVLLLPHGYEGSGPEHSSARLERFLQLCGEDNIQVCNFTTPAQCFHALRRQMKRTFRKPLIVMTPKSLLRSSLSPFEEFTKGQFHEVIDDPSVTPANVKRVLMCSGKVYFDLLKKRDESQRKDVAIVRIEQLYPWPKDQLLAVLKRYPNSEKVWVQEESANNGAWFFVEPLLRDMGHPVKVVTRDASASPATGSTKIHKLEQDELVDAAIAGSVPHLVVAARKRK